MRAFFSPSNHLIRMALTISAIAWLVGCDRGSANNTVISPVSDYAAVSGGLVVEIGPEFFENAKTIYLDDNGKRIGEIWFRISGGEMQVIGKDASGVHGPISEEKLRDGLCNGIVAGGQGGYVRFYSICVSEVPVHSGVNSEGEPIAARTPYFQIATKNGANVSILRTRFSVEL